MSRRSAVSMMIVPICALFAGLAFGQRMPPPGPGANGPNGPGYNRHSGPEGSPFKTKTIAGELVEVKASSNAISLKNKDGKVFDFTLDSKTKLKADKNTELADKKPIELSDFQAGENVEVTVDLSSQRVSELRLKRQKKS